MLKHLQWIGLTLAVAIAAPLEAAYNVSVNTGTSYTTGFVGSFEPTGAQMDGLKVTATFQGGGTDTAFWADTSLTSGAASGTGWNLALAGDTFGNPWVLTVTGPGLVLTNLRIEGGNTGKTVFDLKDLGRTDNGSVTPGIGTVSTGTPGSMHGWTFEFDNQSSYQSPASYTIDINAEYSDIVSLGAAPPVGDLWTVLNLTFSGSGNGVLPNFPVRFFADTDIIDELIPNNAVPEPASLALFGGLAIIGGWYHSRRRGRK